MRRPTTKADEIALVLEQAILSGEVSQGEVLRQDRLSEDFGVSRTPVREALRQLAAVGLVVYSPSRGATVPPVSATDVLETFLVRATLEGLAAELACERLTQRDLRKMKATQRKFRTLTVALLQSRASQSDLRSLASERGSANDAFHDIILNAAGVARLANLARSERRAFRSQAIWSPSVRLEDLYSLNVEQHDAIVDAFEERSSGVRELVERHIRDSGRLLYEALSQHTNDRRRRFTDRVSWSSEVHDGRT